MESKGLSLRPNYTQIVKLNFITCEPVFADLEEGPQSEVPVLKSLLLGLLLVTAVFGIFGNSFTITLLLRKQVSFSQLNPLFIGLSTSDAFLCFHEIIAVALPQFFLSLGIPFEFSEDNVILIMDFQMMSLFTWLTSCTCSLNFMVAISMERFIAVYWPFQAARMLSLQRTKRIAIIIPFVSGLTNISLLIYIIRKKILGRWICFLTPYYKTLVIIFWLSIPTLVIIIPNCFIIKILICRQRQVREMTRQEIKALHTTKMIVCIMAAYLLTTSAGAIHVAIIEDSVTNYNIMNFLMTFNCSINYVFYCMFGSTFRETFTNLFCSSCKKKQHCTPISKIHSSNAIINSISQGK